MTTATTASFELARFAWCDGAFELEGRWAADTDGLLGRAKLCVSVNGRRRRISAQGPPVEASPSGEAWSARFPFADRPARGTAAELEVGRTLVVVLPAAELADPERVPEGGRRRVVAEMPDVTAAATAARQLEELLDRARAEGEGLERVAERAASERRRLESLLERPAEPLPATTSRRAAARAALERPREPRRLLPADDPQAAQRAAYVVAGALAAFTALVLVIVL